jgi:hypothetical protein
LTRHFGQRALAESIRRNDGDAFMVNIPPRVTSALSAEQVFGEIVKPLVTAMGYGSRAGELRGGRAEGNTLPKANLAALATETCKEFEGEKIPALSSRLRSTLEGRNERHCRASSAAGIRHERVANFVPTSSGRVSNTPFCSKRKKFRSKHATVVAERNDGETITAVYGTIFNRYGITNAVKLSPEAAVDAGQGQHL